LRPINLVTRSNDMKKIVFLYLSVLLLLSSCGLNKQARQVKAFEKCEYQITSADSIYLAGRDISKLISDKNIDMSSMPELAFAYLRKDIPLKVRLNLQIKNPTADLAAINQFEYKILIKGQELANGFVNQKVSVDPGSSAIVPVNVNANIYQFLSDGKTMQQIADFIRGGNTSGTEKKGIVTLKIKPTINLAGKLVNYPGYITIDREISSKILF
jgi:hypothetical protein